jgi:hypothetical protein
LTSARRTMSAVFVSRGWKCLIDMSIKTSWLLNVISSKDFCGGGVKRYPSKLPRWRRCECIECKLHV